MIRTMQHVHLFGPLWLELHYRHATYGAPMPWRTRVRYHRAK